MGSYCVRYISIGVATTDTLTIFLLPSGLPLFRTPPA
nr:MAG TPA: hypothetical protein [Caudoviricetes sp.]